MNKLSYEEKVNQYLNAVIRLNRNINARDAEFFTDNTPMYDWFLNQMNSTRKFLKNLDNLGPKSKEKYEMFTKYSLMYQKCLEEYEKKYQVLEVCHDTFGKYTYNSNPWPWEGENV